ncbi:hypothetical protein HHK36_007763 [Tetracentron sinense]|uniref:Uncharacterized protein n=1 Tax=Tetracentron sinense TaxID=13715 RepID=A0A834ZF59_TETSI|nr:hypothetical protein HHK36_007763 [Tetracentron sinense]
MKQEPYDAPPVSMLLPSVNHIMWSPDGSLFGVAYSRHIVQIYSYHGGDDVRQHLEIDAHIGGVNDLAFSHPNKPLSVITCGDDKNIKVWDAANGTKQYIFEGHKAPVYSVYPHYKENIQEGTLLAISANENGIKIFPNADGLRLLRTFESRSFDASRVVFETVTKPTIGPISAVVAATSSGLADRGASVVAIAGMNGETRNLEEANDKSKIWKLTEINEPTQCRSLRLPDNLRTTKHPTPLQELSGVTSFGLLHKEANALVNSSVSESVMKASVLQSMAVNMFWVSDKDHHRSNENKLMTTFQVLCKINYHVHEGSKSHDMNFPTPIIWDKPVIEF